MPHTAKTSPNTHSFKGDMLDGNDIFLEIHVAYLNILDSN